ncbi:MAG: hypothetical protein ABIJ86_13995 [Spirochaetota bacterium]
MYVSVIDTGNMVSLSQQTIRFSDSPPWVQYRAAIDLEGLDPRSPAATKLRSAMEETPQLAALLADVSTWPGTVLNSHRSANQTFHRLSFLADLGVSPGHPAITKAVSTIMNRIGEDGLPRLPMNYPAHFGGPGTELWCWALCDAPVILKALLRFGLGGDARIQRGIETILGLGKSFGWPCAVAPELGTFRGPGRKDEPCPYANLVSLDMAAACMETSSGQPSGCRTLGSVPGSDSVPHREPLADHPAVLAGIEALLDCWEHSREKHPYMFHAGTDFRKLKAPFIWYDILHVADTLSRFPLACRDERFKEMLAVIHAKRQPDGSYIPESVYQPYKAWDFGQKKIPSPWIGFLIARMERQI